MPAYFFDKLVGLVGDEFDMEFKSMKDLYSKEQGDPVGEVETVEDEESNGEETETVDGTDED